MQLIRGKFWLQLWTLKDLGVKFDENLDFSVHIAEKSYKA